jgi:hypothetical protein
VEEPVWLIEIDGLGHVRRDDRVSLADFRDAVHLDCEQYRDAFFAKLPRQRDSFRGAPAMSVEEDAGVLLLCGRQFSIPVAVEKRKNPVVRSRPMPILKGFDVNARAVGITQVFSQLDAAMDAVIVPDEASDKPHNDRLSLGGNDRKANGKSANPSKHRLHDGDNRNRKLFTNICRYLSFAMNRALGAIMGTMPSAAAISFGVVLTWAAARPAFGFEVVTDETTRREALKAAFPGTTVRLSHEPLLDWKPRPWPGHTLTDALRGENEYEVIGPALDEQGWPGRKHKRVGIVRRLRMQVLRLNDPALPSTLALIAHYKFTDLEDPQEGREWTARLFVMTWRGDRWDVQYTEQSLIGGGKTIRSIRAVDLDGDGQAETLVEAEGMYDGRRWITLKGFGVSGRQLLQLVDAETLSADVGLDLEYSRELNLRKTTQARGKTFYFRTTRYRSENERFEKPRIEEEAIESFAEPDSPGSPHFEDYRVAEVFEGTPAAPILATPEQMRYRTRIRDGVLKETGFAGTWRHSIKGPGPNFAGHYFVMEWGCGSQCVMMAIADAKTGTVSGPPLSEKGSLWVPLDNLSEMEIDFRRDTSLLVLRNACRNFRKECGIYYFNWKDNRFTLVRFVRVDPLATEMAR